MNRRLPLVLVLVAKSGRGSPLVPDGGALMGLGCPAEGADAGGHRMFRGSLRGGHPVLRPGRPRGGRGRRVILVFGLQLLHPRVDSVKTLADLLLAPVPGPGFCFHPSSM